MLTAHCPVCGSMPLEPCIEGGEFVASHPERVRAAQVAEAPKMAAAERAASLGADVVEVLDKASASLDSVMRTEAWARMLPADRELARRHLVAITERAVRLMRGMEA